jgi:hypothetical protein
MPRTRAPSASAEAAGLRTATRSSVAARQGRRSRTRFRRRTHLDANIAALDVELGVEDLARLEATYPLDVAAGGRYPAAMMDLVNR